MEQTNQAGVTILTAATPQTKSDNNKAVSKNKQIKETVKIEKEKILEAIKPLLIGKSVGIVVDVLQSNGIKVTQDPEGLFKVKFESSSIMSGDDYALNTSIEEHFDSSKYQPFISVNKAVKLTQDYMDEIKAMAQDAQPTDQNGNPIILSSTQMTVIDPDYRKLKIVQLPLLRILQAYNVMMESGDKITQAKLLQEDAQAYGEKFARKLFQKLYMKYNEIIDKQFDGKELPAYAAARNITQQEAFAEALNKIYSQKNTEVQQLYQTQKINQYQAEVITDKLEEEKNTFNAVAEMSKYQIPSAKNIKAYNAQLQKYLINQQPKQAAVNKQKLI